MLKLIAPDHTVFESPACQQGLILFNQLDRSIRRGEPPDNLLPGFLAVP